MLENAFLHSFEVKIYFTDDDNAIEVGNIIFHSYSHTYSSKETITVYTRLSELLPYRKRKYINQTLSNRSCTRLHAFQYAFPNTGLSVMIVYETITNSSNLSQTHIPSTPCRNHIMFTAIHPSNHNVTDVSLCERKRERGTPSRWNC